MLRDKERRRVVVTGLGVITPSGPDVETAWDNLTHGRSGIVKLENELTRIKVAGKVPNFNDEEVLSKLPRKVDPERIDSAVIFSLGASDEALRSSNLVDQQGQIFPDIDRTRIGAIIGTGAGGSFEIGNIRRLIDSNKKVLARHSMRIFIERVATVPSMVWGFQGPTYSVSAACATGNVAIAAGMDEIELHRADIMLVGGAEGKVNELTLEVFQALRAVTREGDPSKASRPFDKKRGGFVVSEGAGILILEELNHALKRGAIPLAELVGQGITADGDIKYETAPTGEGEFRAMKLASNGEPELTEDTPIYINFHATATDVGDVTEAKSVKKAFPRQAKIYGWGPKGPLGHMLGAAGAVETILTIKTLETGLLPPMVNLDDPIPELEGVIYSTDKAIEIDARYAFSNAFGFGGENAVLALKSYGR